MAKAVKERRLKFIKKEDYYEIFNLTNQYLGKIAKRRNGAWMHWNLVISDVGPDEELTFSPGCQDEIREFCKNPEKFLE